MTIIDRMVPLLREKEQKVHTVSDSVVATLLGDQSGYPTHQHPLSSSSLFSSRPKMIDLVMHLDWTNRFGVVWHSSVYKC